MTLLVMLTGAVGFIASYIFLHAGLTDMWLRYPAALGVAYLAFLGLLWLWLRTRAEDYTDVLHFTNLPISGSGNAGHSGAHVVGKGGSFDGGGASASFDSADEGSTPTGAVEDADTPVGDAVGSIADADEFAIPLAAVVLVAALCFSSLFIVYSAPLLFAELLVDGVLSASLYRRLRGLETRHWLETALRRTVWPFMLTAFLVAASGWAMALYAPGAKSVGDVLLHQQHRQ
ncbi:hypothetical protein D3871_04730 [Noviherbaspirillum saxi]|uniref:Uncharacterized protein n=2 Tax=Noviherbaspirillum saxi TaxID=2320863 RepID=A0A3A3FPV3_9BURK|nr:hypothetical protein D3871_04730 [Noviherbaspirillum saxi]